MMRSLQTLVGALTTSTARWVCVGVAVWFFLGTPYAVSATECWYAREDGKVCQCLKDVARDLRADSNIATYATATVAAIIALQLPNRNRVETIHRRDSSGHQKESSG